MKKKYIFIIIVVIIVLLIIVLFISLGSTNKKGVGVTPATISPSIYPSISSTKYLKKLPFGSSSRINTVQASVTPESLSPEEVAGKFYSWYLKYPGMSALTSGAYKDNVYLTDKFKHVLSIMASLSNLRDDPVFCSANKSTKFTVLPATVTPDGWRSVMIRNPQGRDLYEIILENSTGKWLVADTICIP